MHNNLVDVLCASFVLLFVYTAISKLSDHQNFQDQLFFITQNAWMAAVLALGVPLAELAIALALCINKGRRAGLFAFVSLLCCFTAWIIYLLLSDRNLPCTCGGVISSLTWKQHLLLNGCFLFAGIAAILLQTTKINPETIAQTTKSF